MLELALALVLARVETPARRDLEPALAATPARDLAPVKTTLGRATERAA